MNKRTVKLLKSAKKDFGVAGKRGDEVEVANDVADLMIEQKYAKEIQLGSVLSKAGGTSSLVCFIKSPTGAYGLGYNRGEMGYVKDEKLRAELVKEGFAYVVEDEG